ncbi:3D domain-containing protein [Candidatus Parcubacteria bacterium]|nr:3D domain-containing protein [Candidatus Parcubacteria bacterium]
MVNRFRVVPKRRILVTAYSSTLDQTDASPFVTARGTLVRDGIVAANFLPFGTKVRFPKIWPHKVFTVEDRMHARFSNRVDIWFPTRGEAQAFGLKITELEIF